MEGKQTRIPTPSKLWPITLRAEPSALLEKLVRGLPKALSRNSGTTLSQKRSARKMEMDLTRILEKQNSLQMSQIFSRSRTLVFRSFCFSRILQARPLHHVDAAPNPTLIPLNLAGLRRGLANERPFHET